MVPTILIFGEIIPKVTAYRRAKTFASIVAIPLSLFYRLLYPLQITLGKIMDFVVSAFQPSRPQTIVPPEERLRAVAELIEEEGIILPQQRDLIFRVVELGRKKVGEVMTPRMEIFSLSAELRLDRALRKLKGVHYSRIPLYEGDRENVVGILYVKDLLRALKEKGKAIPVRAIMRRPYFVPLTKNAAELLRDFRAKRLQMAIVVDEYGGLAGLVTMEDLLEELFGELRDEFDGREWLWEKIDEKNWLFSAKIPLEKFEGLLGVEIPEARQETLGGFLLDLFGRLPREGEKIEFQGIEFEVIRVERRAIRKIMVRRL